MALNSTAMHSPQEWDHIRALFADLYLRQEFRLKDVAMILAREHDFHATPKQYKTWIHRWGIFKNVKKTDIFEQIRSGRDLAELDEKSVRLLRRKIQRRGELACEGIDEGSSGVTCFYSSCPGIPLMTVPRQMTTRDTLALQYTLAGVAESCTWLWANAGLENCLQPLAGLGFGWRRHEQSPSSSSSSSSPPPPPITDAMYHSFCAANDALTFGVGPMAMRFFREAFQELIQCLQSFNIMCLIRMLDAMWMLTKAYAFVGQQNVFQSKGLLSAIVKRMRTDLGPSNPIANLIAATINFGHTPAWQLSVWQALIDTLEGIQSTGSATNIESVIEVARYYHAKNLLRAQNFSGAVNEYESISQHQLASSWNSRRTRFRLAELYWTQGDSNKAAITFNGIIEDGRTADDGFQTDGIQWESHHCLAIIYAKLGHSVTAKHHHLAAFDGALRAYGTTDAETVFLFRDLMAFLNHQGNEECLVAELKECHAEINNVLNLPADTVEGALLRSRLRPSSSKFLTVFFGEMGHGNNGNLSPRLGLDYAIVAKPTCPVTEITGVGPLRMQGDLVAGDS